MSQPVRNTDELPAGPVDRPVRPLSARLDVLRVLLAERHPEHHQAVADAQGEIDRLRLALLTIATASQTNPAARRIAADVLAA